jgi:hypothetical protein
LRRPILLIALLGANLWPQTALSDGMLIDAARPSVYVVRTVTPTTAKSNDDWLELHNNTRWAINIRTESLYIGDKVMPLTLRGGKGVLAMRSGVVVSPCYAVEAVPKGPSDTADEPYQRLKLGAVCTVGSTSWIPSGGMVLMRVPNDHLTPGRRISIDFQYEWENARDVEHRVLFTKAPERQKH